MELGRFVVLINDRDPKVWEAFPVAMVTDPETGKDIDVPISGNSLKEITDKVIAQRQVNEPDNWLWRPDKFCVVDTSTDEHFWPVGPTGGWALDDSDSFESGPEPSMGIGAAWAGWYGATDSQAIAIGELVDSADMTGSSDYTPQQIEEIQAVFDDSLLNNSEIVQRLAKILGV